MPLIFYFFFSVAWFCKKKLPDRFFYRHVTVSYFCFSFGLTEPTGNEAPFQEVLSSSKCWLSAFNGWWFNWRSETNISKCHLNKKEYILYIKNVYTVANKVESFVWYKSSQLYLCTLLKKILEVSLNCIWFFISDNLF